MNIQKEIKEAMESKKLVIGSNRTLKELKSGKVKFVIIAGNCPKSIMEDVKHNAKLSKVEINEFSGNGVELGTLCKKPFLAAVVSIKK
jgi:large subunit ribosomal protein L30e